MNNQTETPTQSNDDTRPQNPAACPDIEKGVCLEEYQSAYQTGHEGYDRYLGKSFDEAETELKRDYEAILSQQGGEGLAWDKAKSAARDAWDQAGTT